MDLISVVHLHDNAAMWAALAMEEFSDERVPLCSQWAVFQEQFKAQFETVDKMVNAKEKLLVLWQDMSTVLEFTAIFKQLIGDTSYFSEDLQDCYYKCLSPRIKDELVHTAHPISTLDDLIEVATDIDVQIRQCWTERD